MSLINYVEPFEPFGLFVGIGQLIFAITLCVIVWKLYKKIIQWFDIKINREIKYEILEETSLNEIASKRGINLDEELVKRKITHEVIKKKSFRNRIEDQVYENMFGKEETKEIVIADNVKG